MPLPEYLQELHATLRRAEAAYTHGNLAQCLQSAEEGMTILGLPLPKLCKAPVPPHYEILFRCFQHLDAYREALALYKRGLLHYRRPEPGASVSALQAWQKAWQLLETHFSSFDERLTLGAANFDFPVAGRVLRSVVRLREKLNEFGQGTGPPKA